MSRRRRRGRAFAPVEPKPFDQARVVARYARLEGRAVTLSFIPWGPVVEADTPEELRRDVELAILAETGRQRPS